MKPLTSRKRIALLSLAGAAAGYLFLHPYTMMVYDLYGHSGAPDGHRSFQRLLTTIVLSFHPDMLLMGIPFVLLGAVSGMLLGSWLSARAHQIEMEKNSLAVETVRQLTVTLAHHLLNAAAGVRLAASWAIRKEQDEEIRRRLEAIREEARRIEAVVATLKTLDTVATERYIKGSITMMIDIRKELMERLERSESEQRPDRPPPPFRRGSS